MLTKSPLCLIWMLVLALPAAAADITFRVTVPVQTPPADTIYVAGSFQGWNPGSASHALAPVGPFQHEITLSFDPGTNLQFKFTRGDWSKVEKGASGEEIPNRTFTVVETVTLELEVLNWADVSTFSTITGDVTQVTVPGLFDDRRVWVYLPPTYHDEIDENYPVLYMLDGQNVFDAGTSFAGEWEVDETCEELMSTGEMAPLIVVAVDNGGAGRIDEYTPWFDPTRNAGGGGEAHLQQFVDVLVPWVEANYRVETGPAHTGFAGSSLGGLMAAYAAYRHPDVFGRIASVSPSIWWADREILDFIGAREKPGASFYVDMGTAEGSDGDNDGIPDPIENLRDLRDLLVGQGFTLDADLMVVEDAGGQHNEPTWSERFPEALKFLFPPTIVPTEGGTISSVKQRFHRPD